MMRRSSNSFSSNSHSKVSCLAQTQTLEQEEDDNDVLPRPPLFAYRPPEDPEELDSETYEPDKWRMFHELRQKRKKLLREANPFAGLKTPPPPLPPMFQTRFHSRRKYRRRFFKGKTFFYQKPDGANDEKLTEAFDQQLPDAITAP